MLKQSAALLERARRVMPGGVNSPVRAFKSVGGTPPFIARAAGAHVWDVDGNQYVDFVLTWGPAILGHANPQVVAACQAAIARGSSFGAPTELEVELAEMIIDRVPGCDLVRLVNSGTEACMSAIRVARGFTGRDKVVKFTGCYHGHADSFLIAAGSGALTLGTPNSPGVTNGTAKDTLLAPFNDIASLRRVFEANRDEVAALILEPVCGNTGCIAPAPNYHTELRTLCDEFGVLLIFDEVMTGFRIARGGAAELYGVIPDMFCFGKVVGGGFPLAAYGGREDIMRHVAPDGPIYQGGTLSGNPVAVTAGIETLKQLGPAQYAHLEAIGAHLEARMAPVIEGYPLSQQRVGSMFGLFFHPGPIARHEDVADADIPRFNRFFHGMLERGIYLAPSQYETGFLSIAHDIAMIDDFVDKAADTIASVFE